MAFNITYFSNKWANFKEELKDYFNKRVLDKNGDTMIGELILSKNPDKDMEASTKRYVDYIAEQLVKFHPGDNRSISFGSVYFQGTTFQASTISKFIDVEQVSEVSGTYAQYAYPPLANGSVKIKGTIPKISPYMTFKQYSDGAFKVADWSNFLTTLRLSLQIVLVTDGTTEIPIWSESNIYPSQARNDKNSLFGNLQEFEIDEVPLKMGVRPFIRVKTTVHEMNVSVGHIVDSTFSIGSNAIPVTGWVSTPILDTSIIYET